VTGCGCLLVIAAIVAFLVIFIRGSFDSGEPIAQALALSFGLALLLQRWRRERATHELVRPRRAQHSGLVPALAGEL
jgi:hypothetical protein